MLFGKRMTPIIRASGFIQVQLFLRSFFIDKVKSDHLYVVWQTNDSNNTRLWRLLVFVDVRTIQKLQI